MIKKCMIISNDEKSIPDSKGLKNLYLHKILGLTPLERIIFSAKENGISDFCLVVNGDSEKIKNQLNENHNDVNIDIISSTNSSNLNSDTISKLNKFTQGENILLVKGNHIIDRKIYKELLNEESALKNHSIIAATEKNGLSPDVKHSGAYICNNEFFEKAHTQTENGNAATINDILSTEEIKRVSGQYQIHKSFWQNINDKQDIKLAEKKLLKSCIKEADSFLSRGFTRPISLSMSRHFSRTGVTPNQITYMNLVLGLLSAFLVTSPTYFINVIGLLLFEFTVIFDGVDGEIARLKFKSSKKGAQIDTVIDFIIRVAFFTALGIVNLKFHQTSFDYFFSITTPILSVITMTISVILLLKYNIPDEGCFSKVNMDLRKEAGPITKFFGLIMKPEGFTSIFVILGIFRLYRAMLVIAALGYIGFTIYNIVIAVREFRTRSENNR